MNPVTVIFQPLHGLPCWNVKPGWGSFLTLEFGEPHLEIREPRAIQPHAAKRVRALFARRRVVVRGRWHLWIYGCEWHVYTADTLIGDSNLHGSTKERIQLAARELDGQKLLQVTADPDLGRSTFHFDLDSRLETRPYAPDTEQWHLYQPDGNVLTYRSDGHFAHCAGDTPAEQTNWQPVLLGRE